MSLGTFLKLRMYFIFIVAAFIQSACFEKEKRESSEKPQLHKKIENQNNDVINAEEIISKNIRQDIISFSFAKLKRWRKNNLQSKNGTVVIDVLSSIDSALLHPVLLHNHEIIKIKRRFITSLSLLGNDGVLDLRDWIHYYSNWKEITADSNQGYKVGIYSKEQKEKFPSYKLEELEMAIQEHENKYLNGKRIFPRLGVESVSQLKRIIDITSIEFDIVFLSEIDTSSYLVRLDLYAG